MVRKDRGKGTWEKRSEKKKYMDVLVAVVLQYHVDSLATCLSLRC